MVKIILAFLFAATSCDLIGYNRLGNNVYSHNFVTENNPRANYRNLAELILKQYDGDIKSAALTQRRTRHSKFNRLGLYKIRMLNH